MKKIVLVIYTEATQSDIQTAIRVLIKVAEAKIIEINQTESELPKIVKNNN